MRFIALIIFFLIGLTNIVLASDNVGKLDFEKLFYGDIIDPQNHIKPIGMALIGDFSGAILENDKNKQFFIMEGDEINLENQIFHIKSISPDGIVLRSKLEKETILRFPDQKKIIEKKVVGDWKNPTAPSD